MSIQSNNKNFYKISSVEYDQLTLGDRDSSLVLFENMRIADQIGLRSDSDFIEQNWVDFTDSEFDAINQLIDAVPCKVDDKNRARLDAKYKLDSKNVLTAVSDTVNLQVGFSVVDHIGFTPGLTIIKLRDEWFCVLVSAVNNHILGSFLKCDQFDGLINAIKECVCDYENGHK